MKRIFILIAMVSMMFLVVGCSIPRDEDLVGRWVLETDSDFVTTFNEGGLGTHSICWGYGTEFEWRTPEEGNITWNYSDHPRMLTPYRISGDALYITLFGPVGSDDNVLRFTRD